MSEYFDGQRTAFEVRIAPAGSAFQLAVWAQLRGIPYGGRRSYRDIAKGVGSPEASRAVGIARASNPLALVVPCHRVLGATVP